jgi:anti-sigma factor RsiW
MTCHEFRNELHEYLDEGLEPARQTAARAHVAGCKECQLAVQRTQRFGRTLHHAMQRAAADISLEPELSRRIALAAQPRRVRSGAGWRAWEWLVVRPYRALGAAALVGILAFAVQSRRQSINAPDLIIQSSAQITFSIDVPFQTDRQVGVTHAEFSAPLKP